LHDFAQNQIWCAIVALAGDRSPGCSSSSSSITPRTTREPKRLRLRLLTIAGRLAATVRRRGLHLAADAAFIGLTLAGLQRLDRLVAPG
jgi:hypothetical protein